MFIADRLKTCREERNLTQSDLIFELDKVGLRMSRQTLINWESGETIPDAGQLSVLAMFFDKPVGYFFDQKLYQNGKSAKA